MPLATYNPDVPLHTQLTNILKEAGHVEPADWEEYAENFVPQAIDESLSHPEQRFYINRTFRMYMCESSVDSSDARTHLIDDGRLIDWLRHFEQGVVPWLLKNTQIKIS